jgi:hypothetical protein
MSTIERISGAVLPYCRWRFAGAGAQQPALGCEWASLQVQSLQPDSLVEGLGRWAPGSKQSSLHPLRPIAAGTAEVSRDVHPVKWRVNECVKLKVLIIDMQTETPNRRHNTQRSRTHVLGIIQ